MLARVSAALLGAVLFTGVAHAEDTTIKFTLGWKTQGSDAAFFYAKDNGYFKEEGLNVVIDQGEGSGATVTRIMSGAYETNWKKHPGMQNSYMLWQNKLPLYNMRMQNLSAAVIRPQLPEVARRVAQGRSNHDYVAYRLNQSPWLDVPPPLAPELREVGLVDYYRASGNWGDFCKPVGEDDFECH